MPEALYAPIIPLQRPAPIALMLVGMGLVFFVLYRMRQRHYFREFLLAACLGCAFFLLYATFPSLSVVQTHTYRLQKLMQSARDAFGVNGELWSLGYLLPMAAVACGRAVQCWQVILCGAVLSASIEIVELVIRLGMLDVDDLMRQCDIAISAAGMTLYELCACGTPTISYCVAENQKPCAAAFKERGVMPSAGEYRRDAGWKKGLVAAFRDMAASAERRRRQSDAMRQMVDGEGAGRLAEALMGNCQGE